MRIILLGGVAIALETGFLILYGMSGFPNTIKWNLSVIAVSLGVSCLLTIALWVMDAGATADISWGLNALYLFLFVMLVNRFAFPAGTNKTFARIRKSQEPEED